MARLPFFSVTSSRAFAKRIAVEESRSTGADFLPVNFKITTPPARQAAVALTESQTCRDASNGSPFGDGK